MSAKWMTVGTIGWIVGMVCVGIASAQAPPAPLPEPDGVPKNRFISFSFPPSPEGTQWAVRVTLVKMYNTDPADEDNEACPERLTERPDLSDFDGEIRWVAPPENFPEGGISDDPNQLVGAPLQCCPRFRDWSREMDTLCAPRCSKGTCSFSVERPPPFCTGDDECLPAICDTTVLHVFGAEIVPCSQYEVQLVDVSCPDLTDESCYSDPLTVHTAKWGDVWAPLGGPSQPNFTDIGKVLDKFMSRIPPRKVQAMLRDNVAPASGSINFNDIGRAVDAFKWIAYWELGPSACVEACE